MLCVNYIDSGFVVLGVYRVGEPFLEKEVIEHYDFSVLPFPPYTFYSESKALLSCEKISKHFRIRKCKKRKGCCNSYATLL